MPHSDECFESVLEVVINMFIALYIRVRASQDRGRS